MCCVRWRSVNSCVLSAQPEPAVLWDGYIDLVDWMRFVVACEGIRTLLKTLFQEAVLCQYICCIQPDNSLLGLFHAGKLLESLFQNSLSKVYFRRKLSGVNGPLSKVYHFLKWLSQNKTFYFVKVTFKSGFRKELSSVKGALRHGSDSGICWETCGSVAPKLCAQIFLNIFKIVVNLFFVWLCFCIIVNWFTLHLCVTAAAWSWFKIFNVVALFISCKCVGP